jgi:putative hemolysin
VVPERRDLGALLRELRAERQPVALVADEYGATAGLVTLEDILEELVGDIEDEFDLPDATMERLDEHTLRVAGSVSVDDVDEALGVTLPRTGPHTLAGLVFAALGRRPVVGDRVVLGGVEVTVAELDGVRITRLTLELPAADAA